ncbi:hypothetical protein D9M70_572740 [compost metagenome]
MRSTEWMPSQPTAMRPRTGGSALPSLSWKRAVTESASCSTPVHRALTTTLSSPRRWRTAASKAICRSPRWMEYCGQS